MISDTHLPGDRQWGTHLLVPSGLIAVGCLGYLWSDPRPLSIPQVALPLAVSLVLGGYAVRLTLRNDLCKKALFMARYGWIGALFAVAIGVGELALYRFTGLSVRIFPDMILTFLSIGLVTGVVTARALPDTRRETESPDREQVLAETIWTGRSASSPIVSAIVDALAEVEGVESTDLDPIYTHVEPSVFDTLNTTEASPWQFTFQTEDYVVRVSSAGTVTVYDRSPAASTDGSETGYR